jgi:hypothetical protein
MQVSASTTALSFSILMDSTGHAGTHVPQPEHFSGSTFAGIIKSSFLLFQSNLIDFGISPERSDDISNREKVK